MERQHPLFIPSEITFLESPQPAAAPLCTERHSPRVSRRRAQPRPDPSLYFACPIGHATSAPLAVTDQASPWLVQYTRLPSRAPTGRANVRQLHRPRQSSSRKVASVMAQRGQSGLSLAHGRERRSLARSPACLLDGRLSEGRQRWRRRWHVNKQASERSTPKHWGRGARGHETSAKAVRLS
jgi:hypothetical protein